VNEHFPRSFLADRLGGRNVASGDAVVAGLAPVPREVLRHLLDGHRPKAIASVMGLAHGTVKNYVNAIHRRFSVRGTPELLVECYRRRVESTSWAPAAPRSGRRDA
jgi:DNA-binding CsgD family transcriptional regulator